MMNFRGFVAQLGSDNNVSFKRTFSPRDKQESPAFKARLPPPRKRLAALLQSTRRSPSSDGITTFATAPNSTFSTQEFLSSYSQHNEVNRHLSTEEFRNLERRIERERERRTNTETSGNNSRLDGKGQRDESSPVEMSRKNYFRPMGRNNYFSRDTSVPTSRMNGSNPDSLVAMGTLAISPSPRGGGSTCISYSGGSSGSQKDCFNTRLRSPPPRTKGKSVISSSMSPMAPDRSSKMAKYVDPIGGAPPCFTQRLAELSSLECETIRYERTRKLKRQSKQAKQD
ncbi:uncharacterized protein [Ptychodera flava]|uniref:uncharacterized protein isoform X4 n=1 Tax=Ptychodera flava TaxID=63121 RepID=UPI003969BFD1